MSRTRDVSPPPARPSTVHSRQRFQWCFFSLLFIALTGLYLDAFSIKPYGDDLLRLTNAALHGFNVQYEFYKYRPIERIITAANYSLFGTRTYLGVFANILGMCLNSLIVWKIASYFRPDSYAYPCTASVFFAFHSINTSAVFQIDTISQQYATVFALLAFYWYVSNWNRSPFTYHGIGTLLLFLMLMSKEMAIGVALALPLAVAVAKRYNVEPDSRMLRRDAVLGICGSLVATASFMYLWQTVGGFSMWTVGVDYGRAWSPVEHLRGMTLLYGSVVYLGSTLDVLVKADITNMIVSGVLSFVFFALALSGFVAAARARIFEFRNSLGWLGATVAIALAASFPVSALGRPSELYGNLIVPFVALAAFYFVDLGLLKVMSRVRVRSRYMQMIGASLLAVYVIWMSLGTVEKLTLARQTGERSARFLAQIVTWQESLPEGRSEVCIVGDYDDNGTSWPTYSVFIKENRDLLSWLIHGYANVVEPRRTIVVDGFGRETCEHTLQVSGGRLQFRASR